MCTASPSGRSALTRLVVTTAGSLALIGCGGGTTGSVGSEADRALNPNPTQPAIQEGVFKDANVRGLAFVSGTERGITDARGRYTCKTGEPLSFAIGGVKLGETACTTLVHPPALIGDGTLYDPGALNLARFLMMLDQDGDASNGIFISDALRGMAANWAQIDFGASDFDARLSSVIADIATIENRVVTAPPTTSEAYAHMESTLACAYSGAFAGSLTDAGRDAGSVTLIITQDPDTHVVEFELEYFLNPAAAPAFTQSLVGEIQLENRMRFYDRGTTPADSPRWWEFVAPDRIKGHWKDWLTMSFAAASTDFVLHRLGSDTSDRRFVGRFVGQGFHGVVELGLSTDQLTGVAVAFISDERFVVTGTTRGDQVELTIGTATASATLFRDSSGSAIGLRGGWPGAPSGSVDAVGCRLN